MNTLYRAFSLLTLWIACAAAFAASVPPRVEVRYQVSMGSLKIGEGHDVFVHDGKTYSVVSESKTAGVAAAIYRLNIRRESRGSITPAGLRPESFIESRNGQAKRSARFDWRDGQVTLTDGDKVHTVPLPEHTWDATSFAWNFAFVPPQGSGRQVHLTDGRRVKEYRYAFIGRETLDTAIGQIETLHVKKIQDEDDKRAFEVWLAVDQHYAPVRIRYTEKDGTAFDSRVIKIDISPR